MGKSKYESVHGLKDKQRVLCHRCQKTEVVMYVSPGDDTPRALCFQCKKRENDKRNVELGDTDSLISSLARHMLVNHGAEKPVVLTPEDDGFKQRADEFWANRREQRERNDQYHWNTFGRTA